VVRYSYVQEEVGKVPRAGGAGIASSKVVFRVVLLSIRCFEVGRDDRRVATVAGAHELLDR